MKGLTGVSVRKICRRGLLAVVLGLLFAACGAGSASGAQMAQANQLYEAGQYAEAVEAYETLLATGIEDGRLYYNLGNAYYKAGDLGRAILNYRRAERLLPRDGDVAANLELARAQTRDQIEETDEGAVIRLVRRLSGWLTLNEAALLALALWLGLCGLGIGAILRPARRRWIAYLALPLALLLLLGLLVLGARLYEERAHPSAVLVAEEVDVHSGPGTDYLLEFSLHAGTEVRVVEERAGWARIALPGGLQGWVPQAAVTEI